MVVHVLHTGGAIGTAFNPSDAVIQGAIDYLNTVYNGTLSPEGVGEIGVQFILATRDPYNNPTNGIHRVPVGLTDYVTYGVKLKLPMAFRTASSKVLPDGIRDYTIIFTWLTE